MKYFTIRELTKSDTALKLGIPNNPNETQEKNMVELIEGLLDPVRIAYGKPIYINSGFRSEALNKAVNGSKTSQHMKGQAADIDTRKGKKENKKLFELIRDNFTFDQLIDEKDLSWIHVSFVQSNRKQVLKIG